MPKADFVSWALKIDCMWPEVSWFCSGLAPLFHYFQSFPLVSIQDSSSKQTIDKSLSLCDLKLAKPCSPSPHGRCQYVSVPAVRTAVAKPALTVAQRWSAVTPKPVPALQGNYFYLVFLSFFAQTEKAAFVYLPLRMLQLWKVCFLTSQNRLTQGVTPLSCNREVLGSNFGGALTLLSEVFRDFPRSLVSDFGLVPSLRLTWECFLPHHFQFLLKILRRASWCVRKALVCVGLDTSYLNWEFPWFPQFLQENAVAVPRLRHDHFLQNSLQFSVIRLFDAV
jgi:hypothetical protein